MHVGVCKVLVSYTHVEFHVCIDSNCQQCGKDDEQENKELQHENTSKTHLQSRKSERHKTTKFMLTKRMYTVSQKGCCRTLTINLSNLNRFLNVCTAGKRMKFATKPILHYPPHFRNVVTLPWEIKNSKCLQIFSRYRRKCKKLIFSVFKITNFPPTDFYVTILLLIYFCDQFMAPEIHHSRQTSLQCLSTINMVFSDKDNKDYFEKLVFEGLHCKEVDRRISHGQSCGSVACPLNSRL